jgi:trehalose/maltose hydrolase-like predicted phosphorylase
MAFFADALQSDVMDSQHGTSAEGIHLGAMAGTVDQVLRVSTGIEVKGDVLLFNPELPPEMATLDVRLRYRGHSLGLQLTHDALTICGDDLDVAPIALSVAGQLYDYVSGTTRVFELKRGTKADPVQKP